MSLKENKTFGPYDDLENAISVRNLYAVYDPGSENQLIAVNDLSFDFKKNKIYFVIGNSGSGKSTLVAHFNGLLKSKYGIIKIDDISINGKKDLQKVLLFPLALDNEEITQMLNDKLIINNRNLHIVIANKNAWKSDIALAFEGNYKLKPQSVKILKSTDFKQEIDDQWFSNTKIALITLREDEFVEILDSKNFNDVNPNECNADKIRIYNRKNTGKIKEFKKLRKKVSMVFQFPEYQLFKDTIEKDIMFGPMALGTKKPEAKILAKKYLNKLGLDDSYLERSPFALSGGQKRRVAIAGILSIEPNVLIFDEPTAGLDPAGEKEMMGIIEEAKRDGKTVFVITHTMEHVLEVADYVLVMDQGEIIKHGVPYEIFTDQELIRTTSIDVPRVIHVIQELMAEDKIFTKLMEKQPNTIEKLSDEIALILNDQKGKGK